MEKFSESIDEFPLPPSTPRLSSFGDACKNYPVPELDRNFRFPIADADRHKIDDPERTYKRLRHESDALAARLARELTELESPTGESFVACGYELCSQTVPSSPARLRPKTSYNPISPPRFPFKDFAEWDLTREADEVDEIERDREASTMPHAVPRVRARSLHCRISPWRKEKLEFIFPVDPSEPLITQQCRQPVDQKRLEKAGQEEHILRETRKAALAISKAGFNFGFEDAKPVVSNSLVDTKPKPKLKPMKPSNSQVVYESTMRHTVLKRQPLLSSSGDLDRFGSPLVLDGSGGQLYSLPPTSMSAPPCVSRFPDLPMIMRRDDENEPKTRIKRSSVTLRTEGISAWSPTPEVEKMQQETERRKLMSDLARDRKKRWAFLVKMKNSFFWRKKC